MQAENYQVLLCRLSL